MKHDATMPQDMPFPPAAPHAALAELPEKYNIPLLLHHLEGRTEQETAALLGCGLSAASVRLARGRELLRKRLAKHGVTASVVGIVTALAQETSAAVEPAFAATVSQAAVTVVAGGGVAAAASAPVVALMKGALHMLFMAKLKVAALAMATVALSGGSNAATCLAAEADPATQPAADAPPAAPVAQEAIPLARVCRITIAGPVVKVEPVLPRRDGASVRIAELPGKCELVGRNGGFAIEHEHAPAPNSTTLSDIEGSLACGSIVRTVRNPREKYTVQLKTRRNVLRKPQLLFTLTVNDPVKGNCTASVVAHADSLDDLRRQHPQPVATYLDPLLRELNVTVEAVATQPADPPPAGTQPVDEKATAELIRLLGAEDFAVREDATRKLIALGKAVHPLLAAKLQEAALDLEAANRIRSILEVVVTLRGTAIPQVDHNAIVDRTKFNILLEVVDEHDRCTQYAVRINDVSRQHIARYRGGTGVVITGSVEAEGSLKVITPARIELLPAPIKK